MSLTEPWTKPTANYRPLSSCHLPDDRWSRRDNEGIEAKPQRLFSKTTFDDIIVRRAICLWPRNPPIEQRWFKAPAHSEEET